VEMPTEENPVVVHNGDCLDLLPRLGGVDAVVTDPPYALVEPNSARSSYAARMATGRTDEDKQLRRGGFMGKAWDSELPGVDIWSAVLRVLKPGGYLLAFGGTRTYHRLTCAIEDAGFEVRDCLMWLYGVGFPKGQGCLKPAWEPILLARKPGKRVLPLGIEECRIGTTKDVPASLPKDDALRGWGERPGRSGKQLTDDAFNPNLGRYPANLLHDGSDEVMEAFAAFGEKTSGVLAPHHDAKESVNGSLRGKNYAGRIKGTFGGDTGTAARFFYCAKASKAERGEGNTHPTVKPLELMQWLVRLVTPKGGVVLDPFAGSGTTGKAALVEGRRAILVEREPAYCDIIRRRLDHASGTGKGSLFAGATN